GQPLWYWCEVAYWLLQNNLIKEVENQEAQEIAAINSILELEHLKRIAPKVTEALIRDSCVCKDMDGAKNELQDA
ncbi:MAG: hypothetical protein ACC628_04525, partial [Pirellulaceae bacterium]